MARKPISRVDLTKIAERFFKAKKERIGPPVQIGPLTVQDLQGLGPAVADPVKYQVGSRDLIDQYIRLVLEPDPTGTPFRNLNPATRARFEQLQRTNPALFAEELQDIFSAENLDLSILNRSAASEIYKKQRASVLSLDGLVERFGFPGLSSRSENLYRHLTRYEMDLLSPLRAKEQIHPFFHALMRTNFNIKEFATDITDLSTGKTRIRNPMSSDNLVSRMSKVRRIERVSKEGKTTEHFVNLLGFDPETEAGELKTILTWDTETTGLTPDSRIRSMSLVKRQVRVLADGTTKMEAAPEVIMTKHFRADIMDTAHIYEEGSPVSKAVSLSERNNKKRNGSSGNWHSRIRKSNESL